MGRFLLLLITASIFSILPFSAFAQNFRSGQDTVLGKDEVINKDYFAAGNTVSLEGTVNGDAYLAGGNIVVYGTINGDLLAAGGNIDIRGTVTGNIRSAGGNINITGTVGRNAALAGGNINFSAETKGNLALAAGQSTIGSKIGGDVNTAIGQLNLAPGASIAGDLNYLSKNQVKSSQGAVVSGKTTQSIPPEGKPQEQVKRGAGFFFGFFILGDFILSAVLGILFIKLMPVHFDKTSQMVLKRPWLSLGIGFLAVILSPFIFLLLLVTIIGIPVAFIMALVLGIFLFLAKLFISFIIGRFILDRTNKDAGKIWAFLLGLLLYSILTVIPVFGWLLSAVTALTGLGAILIREKDFYTELRSKQVI